jgi:DNA-binding transcriptional LysR family regulator
MSVLLPDLSLLPALVALLETESVSLAATRLGVTQPAMSRTLGRLRDATGDELLVKAGRGLQRTVRGTALLDPARDALARATQVLSAPLPFEPATARGRVTVAMTEELQAMTGGRLLRRLRARAPGLDVRLRATGDGTVDEGRRGVVDVALSPILPVGMPDLSDFVVRPLYERRFQTVTRRRRRLGLDAFCRADHLLVAPGGREGGYVDDALARLGRTRRVAVTVLSFSSALALIAADDDLVTTLPDDVVQVLGAGLRRKLHVQRCPVETPVLPVALIWHATRSRDPQLRFVIDVVSGAVADVLGVAPRARPRM